MRYRSTTVLLNAMRGSEQYHAMKSSIAIPYARCDCGEPNVFNTDSFVWSKSGSRSTRFGALFGFDFDRFIGRGPPHPLPMSVYHFNVPKAGFSATIRIADSSDREGHPGPVRQAVAPS